MLLGVRVKPINRLPDKRSFLAEVMRKDLNLFSEDTILETNLSLTYHSIISPWHKFFS
jgi:dTDP-4-dehydrorhamnose 3,5-epimerase-like enzyme